MKISRRGFILGATGCAGLRPHFWGELFDRKLVHGNQPPPCELIPRWDPPIAREMPRSALHSWITPRECFYVFNHNPPPIIDMASWGLSVTGEVENPISLSWHELGKFEQVEIINTLECAGNGRAFFKPLVDGAQWNCGAVSNAVFQGPRLRDVLRRARVRATGRHVAFWGMDGTSPGVLNFVRSIPMDKALDESTLLAMRMNHRTLSQEHGFPVRALVPGWIGAASVKRVTRIEVLKQEADGPYMQVHYRLPNPVKPGASFPLTGLPVKSLVGRPADGSVFPFSSQIIEGVAWAGESGVAHLEVSCDAGKTWQRAVLEPAKAKFAWRTWHYRWMPTEPGQFTVLARATDSAGNVQPQATAWNPRGYLWNGIDSIHVTINSRR